MFYKFLSVTFIGLMSVSSFAAVELYSKMGNTECVISNGQAVKTVTALKGELSYSTTTKVSVTGLEAVAEKAMASATGRPNAEEIIWAVTLNGVSAKLHLDDSQESLALIRLLSSVCR